MRRWEFRRPVLGRLVWGWVAFGVVITAASGWVFVEQTRKPKIGRVALNMDEALTRLAPPPKSLHLAPPPTATNVTATAPTNASNGPDTLRYAQTDFADGLVNSDASASEESTTPGPRRYQIPDAPVRQNPGKLVITIDGRPVDTDRRVHKTPGQTPQSSAIIVPVSEPDPALLQSSRYGKLPRIAADGRSAAQLYAHRAPDTDKPGESTLALIVGGLGLNPDLTERAIDELPAAVTLAFAPYAKDLDLWTRKARQKGHEVMLELPMEGYGGNAAKQIGPAGLMTGHSAANNLKRLDWVLSRTQGYFGVTNYLGAKFTADSSAITPVIERINALGLAYIDDTGAAPRKGRYQAGDIAHLITPAANSENITAMRTSLHALANKALEKDFALGKISVSETGLDVIQAFIAGLDDDEITLAPASAVLYVGGQY